METKIELINKESAQLNSEIRIDGKIVVQMNAIVSSETGTATSYSESITDYELYVANKGACRLKLDEFQERVRAKEDAMIAEYKKVEDVVLPEPDPEAVPEG